MADDDNDKQAKQIAALEAKIEALTAQVEASEGKASGILADKKKAQKQAEELQAKLDELEGKGLGEVDKLKRDLEREKSRVESLIKEKDSLESNWKTDKRNSKLSEIGSGLKWLDSVPEKTRKLIIENEFADLEDLGNEVLVKDRLKTVSESYNGLLAADVAGGAGSKPTNNKGSSGQSGGIEKVLQMSDADILKNPAAALMMAAEK